MSTATPAGSYKVADEAGPSSPVCPITFAFPATDAICRGNEANTLGDAVGLTLGTTLGILDGVIVGTTDGNRDGIIVGTTVGNTEGSRDGMTVGTTVGTTVGVTDGTREGIMVGTTVGTKEGITVGLKVGTTLGTPEGVCGVVNHAHCTLEVGKKQRVVFITNNLKRPINCGGQSWPSVTTVNLMLVTAANERNLSGICTDFTESNITTVRDVHRTNCVQPYSARIEERGGCSWAIITWGPTSI